MAWSRREALQLAVGVPLLGCAEEPDPVTERGLGESIFWRGARWIWAHQSPEGAVGGERATAHALLGALSLPRHAVRSVRDAEASTSAASRAAAWLMGRRSRDGALGLAEGEPVGTTAMAIHAMWRLRPPGFGDATYPMLWWLRRRQRTRARGWAGHATQGGFPVGGVLPDEGPVGLSVTRDAVEAMASMGIHANDPAMIEARAFVDRQDTSSGLALAEALCVFAANRPPRAQRVAAAAPLREAHALERGLPYVARAAVVFAACEGPPGWADALLRWLASSQAAEGCWGEDPLEDTPLALAAIGAALRSGPDLGVGTP